MRGRLLLFTENYFRGGGNRYLVDLANCAGARFSDVVVASNPGGLHPDELARLEVPHDLVEARFLTSALVTSRGGALARERAAAVRALDPAVMRDNVRRLRTLVRSVRPDAVISCNGGYPAARATLAAVQAASAEGVPCALSVVGTPVARRQRLRDYEASVDRRVWGACSAVAVNARSIERALTDLRGMPGGLVTVVRNGLPDAVPRADPAAEPPVVGCVSRIEAGKGVHVLVDAFERAVRADRHPGARLRIYGSGPGFAELEERAAGTGVGARIELIGHLEGDIADALSSVSVFAFPSLHEGFPYAILEAMRAGCAIVATAVGGVPEAIEDGVSGLLVPPGDAVALAGALDRLLSDPPLRGELGAAARARFESEFTLDRMCEQVDVLLDRLAAREGGSV